MLSSVKSSARPEHPDDQWEQLCLRDMSRCRCACRQHATASQQHAIFVAGHSPRQTQEQIKLVPSVLPVVVPPQGKHLQAARRWQQTQDKHLSTTLHGCCKTPLLDDIAAHCSELQTQTILSSITVQNMAHIRVHGDRLKHTVQGPPPSRPPPDSRRPRTPCWLSPGRAPGGWAAHTRWQP